MEKANNNNLKQIEEGYDTQSVLCNSEYVWPIIRLKINEELRKKKGLKSRTFKFNWLLFPKLLRTFFYGIKNIFILPSFSYWIFSSSDRRKKINAKYIDRVAGSFASQYPESLIIENPYPLGGHLKKKDLGQGKVLGQTIFFAASKFVSLFLRTPKIIKEDLIQEILKDNAITINYRRIVKDTIAQYRLMKFLLRWARPKAVFFVYSASSMGYIKAIKERNIPVIELQHGVINRSHNAYNLYKDFGDRLFPDYLLTYGKMEIEIFNEANYFIDAKKVFPVGYYFLEESAKRPRLDDLSKTLRKKYQKIVVFSLQDPFEAYTFEFLQKTAALNSAICYLIVPRNAGKKYPEADALENLVIERELNIYECLKIVDYHATINSTCAIESLFFGIPNILFDFKHWARDYYGETLDDTGHTKFIRSPQEFIETLEKHQFYSKEEIANKSEIFIRRNFKENLKEVLEKKILGGNE